MKTDTELARERGERVKRLIRRMGMTQKELASSLYISKEHLCSVLSGKRNLTFDVAQGIADLYDEWVKQYAPLEDPVRASWLMCEAGEAMDYGSDEKNAIADRAILAHEQLKAVNEVLKTVGYSIEYRHKGTRARGVESTYLLKDADGKTLQVWTANEKERFVSEVVDFAEFRLNRLLRVGDADGNH